MEIGDPRQIEVVAEFLSQDAVLMHEGAPAFIEGWGGPNPIPARVFRIESFARTKISALGVEEQRVNVIVHLLHPEAAPPLGHAFRVDVRVVVSEVLDAVRAPTDALVRNGAGWAVFRLEQGRARFTPVSIGDGGGDFHVVRSGLAEGQRVILFPGDALHNGDRVRAALP
jgi:HlyD family secretion protein